jgi:hypothetical protein
MLLKKVEKHGIDVLQMMKMPMHDSAGSIPVLIPLTLGKVLKAA